MKSFPLSEGHLPGLECHEHGEPSVSKASRVPLALKIKRPVPSDQQTRDSAGTAEDGNSGQRDAWWDKHPERVQHVPGRGGKCGLLEGTGGWEGGVWKGSPCEESVWSWRRLLIGDSCWFPVASGLSAKKSPSRWGDGGTSCQERKVPLFLSVSSIDVRWQLLLLAS